MYSVQSGQIVCAGKVDAHNTASDASSYLDAVSSVPDARKQAAASALLHREMEVRIRQAIASELRSTQP